MKKIIIAAIAANGVVGRTRKPCTCCCAHGVHLDGLSTTLVPCSNCDGARTVPANDLPWPRDAYRENMKRFREITMGHEVAAGRITAEGMGKHWPLPGRRNIVVSTTMEADIPFGDFVLERSLTDAIATCASFAQPCERLFILGGPRLWRDALPIADELDLTLIARAWEGDVLFPCGEDFADPRITAGNGMLVDAADCFFECVSREPCPTNAELTFTTWRRR